MTDDDDVLIVRKDVARMLGCSVSTVERIERKDPDFPLGLRVGSRLRRWKRGDIKYYIAHLAAAEDDQPMRRAGM